MGMKADRHLVMEWAPLVEALLYSILARTDSPEITALVEMRCCEIFHQAMPSMLIDPESPKGREQQLVDALHSVVGHLMGEIARLVADVEMLQLAK